jgi:hypothetical protein
MASVRYIVSDMDSRVEFYRSRLGFFVEKHNPEKFAELKLEDLSGNVIELFEYARTPS